MGDTGSQGEFSKPASMIPLGIWFYLEVWQDSTTYIQVL